MSAEIYALPGEPHIYIQGDPLSQPGGLIKRIHFDSGVVDVVGSEELDYPAQFRCAVLASLGQSQEEISNLTNNSPLTIKENIAQVSSKLDFHRRSKISKILLEAGMYQVRLHSQPLNVTPAELAVLTYAAEGKTNIEIADELKRSPLTIKQHFARIGAKNKWSRREALVSAGLFSGQIGFVAVKAAQEQDLQ